MLQAGGQDVDNPRNRRAPWSMRAAWNICKGPLHAGSAKPFDNTTTKVAYAEQHTLKLEVMETMKGFNRAKPL
jgi:hypothetical protein